MKILVTGASGFLGGRLCERLESEGHIVDKVNSKKYDLTRADSLRVFDSCQYDQIYHLAAWTQAGDFCLDHPGEQWIINQLINTHVLSWWQQAQPQAKLISIGTSCSYSPALPLSEEYYLNDSPIDSLFAYAHTKRMLLIGQMALQRQYGLRWLTFVPSTLYGPGYHRDERQMHFIFDLIRKIVWAKSSGEAPVLWGDGYQRRELVYIDDFVTAATTLAPMCTNEIVNIGSGEEYSIRDYARMICDIVGYDFNLIRFDTTRYVGAKSKVLRVEKLKALFPDFRKTPLLDGLQQTIDWFCASQQELLSKSGLGS